MNIKCKPRNQKHLNLISFCFLSLILNTKNLNLVFEGRLKYQIQKCLKRRLINVTRSSQLQHLVLGICELSCGQVKFCLRYVFLSPLECHHLPLILFRLLYVLVVVHCPFHVNLWSHNCFLVYLSYSNIVVHHVYLMFGCGPIEC